MKTEQQLLEMVEAPITSNEAVQQLIALYLRELKTHFIQVQTLPIQEVVEPIAVMQMKQIEEPIASLKEEIIKEEIKEEIPKKRTTRKKKAE